MLRRLVKSYEHGREHLSAHGCPRLPQTTGWPSVQASLTIVRCPPSANQQDASLSTDTSHLRCTALQSHRRAASCFGRLLGLARRRAWSRLRLSLQTYPHAIHYILFRGIPLPHALLTRADMERFRPRVGAHLGHFRHWRPVLFRASQRGAAVSHGNLHLARETAL